MWTGTKGSIPWSFCGLFWWICLADVRRPWRPVNRWSGLAGWGLPAVCWFRSHLDETETQLVWQKAALLYKRWHARLPTCSRTLPHSDSFHTLSSWNQCRKCSVLTTFIRNLKKEYITFQSLTGALISAYVCVWIFWGLWCWSKGSQDKLKWSNMWERISGCEITSLEY